MYQPKNSFNGSAEEFATLSKAIIDYGGKKIASSVIDDYLEFRQDLTVDSRPIPEQLNGQEVAEGQIPIYNFVLKGTAAMANDFNGLLFNCLSISNEPNWIAEKIALGTGLMIFSKFSHVKAVPTNKAGQQPRLAYYYDPIFCCLDSHLPREFVCQYTEYFLSGLSVEQVFIRHQAKHRRLSIDAKIERLRYAKKELCGTNRYMLNQLVNVAKGLVTEQAGKDYSAELYLNQELLPQLANPAV